MAEHVADLGLATASDAEILEAAVDREAVVVSLDSDFHSLLATTSALEPSAIRIRIEGLKGNQLAEILVKVMETTHDELEAGAVVSVTMNRIRVRALPLRK